MVFYFFEKSSCKIQVIPFLGLDDQAALMKAKTSRKIALETFGH